MDVNCASAKCCCLSDIDRHRPAVRAGGGLRGAGGRTRRVRFCWNALRSDHACCLTRAPNRGGLRDVPFLFRAGRDRLGAFSKDVRLSDFMVSLRDSPFLAGDLDGGWGDGVDGAAWGYFSQTYWPCHVFRGEYAGAARPGLHQRADDSLHWIRSRVPYCKASQ